MPITHLPLREVTPDPLVHGRTRLRQRVINQYIAMTGDPAVENTAPPVDAFKDPDGRVWLADGFHRVFASGMAGHKTVPVNLRDGTRQDAILFACGANAQHGQPRSPADKRAAVAALLCAPEFASTTDAEIARLVGVSNHLVARLRKDAPNATCLQDYRDAEARRQALAREKRRAARAAHPQPKPPQPPSDEELADDETLPPAERAQRALLRAVGCIQRAKQGMIRAEGAYPEARHPPNLPMLAELQFTVEDLLPPDKNPSRTDYGAIVRQINQLSNELFPAPSSPTRVDAFFRGDAAPASSSSAPTAPPAPLARPRGSLSDALRSRGEPTFEDFLRGRPASAPSSRILADLDPKRSPALPDTARQRALPVSPGAPQPAQLETFRAPSPSPLRGEGPHSVASSILPAASASQLETFRAAPYPALPTSGREQDGGSEGPHEPPAPKEAPTGNAPRPPTGNVPRESTGNVPRPPTGTVPRSN